MNTDRPERERELEDVRLLQEALGEAYRCLGARDRTVAEVRGHLQRKGVAADAVQSALQELSELGYLDDERFARRFAEDRRLLDGWGSERIGARLRALGVDRALVEQVLGAHSFEDELGGALQLLRRRWGQLPIPDGDRQRALGLLARRGYELELAYDAVRQHGREVT
jgi:regulatory protein